MSDNLKAVQVAVAPNELVADMWRQVLREEGIVAAITPSGMGHAFATNALNEQIVLVREDQAERAREIIAAFESDAEALDDEFDSSSC
jgi:hypothetical protein